MKELLALALLMVITNTITFIGGWFIGYDDKGEEEKEWQ